MGMREKEVCWGRVVSIQVWELPFTKTVLTSQELFILSSLVSELFNRISANEVNPWATLAV